MFNPQMMQQMPDVPSPQELWKDEKNKYRHWVILFFIGIIALIVLSTLVLIFNAINIDDMVEEKRKYAEQHNYNFVASEAKRSVIYQQFVPSGLSILALCVGTYLFVKTTILAYQKHSFKYISQWSTFVVGIAAAISAYSLISLTWSRGFTSYVTENPAGIYSLSYYIASILIWLLISAPLGRVRRLFMISERVQQFKEMQKNPQFQEAQSQFQDAMQKMAQSQKPGAFGPNVAGATVNPQNNQPSTVQQTKPEISPEEKKLKNMSVSELKEVAQELSISGYSKMNKEELIKAILRVTKKDK